MIEALRIAVSGLAAASKRVLGAAQNTANASTPNYTPVDVVSTASPLGGTKADFAPRNPAFVKAYDPNAADADSEGYVNLPNVSLDQEAINLTFASVSYKANAAIIRKVREMDDELRRALDVKA